MPGWLTRGLVLAVLHAAGAVFLAKMATDQSGDRSVLTSVVIALLIGVALMWGSVDGWRRSENPMLTWLIAGVLAGPLGGVLNVIGRGLLVDQTGVSDLWPQVTTGAAFTALLVIVPAGVGLLVGSRLEPPPGAVDASDAEPPAPAPVRRAPTRRSSEAAARRRARHRAATSADGPAPKPRPSGKPARKPAATE